MFSVGLLIGKRPFQDGKMPGKNCPFQDTLPTSSEDPLFFSWTSKASLQATWTFFITSLCSLRHSSSYYRRLVILLHQCSDAEKLVLPNYQLAVSSLSRKHGLATFVHERLRYTLLDQSPPTSEIECLCVDVDGYKIINVYKPPPTRLRTLDLPVFPHPCLYAGDFNCRHADWGYDDNSPNGECLAGWASINCLARLYNAKDAASFYSGRWNTGTNPDLAFTSVGPNSRLPDRRVLDKFPRSQHWPSLVTPPRFAMAVPSMPVKRWNFRKAKWSHYIALPNKFAKTLLPPNLLDVDAAYQDFCNTIKISDKKTNFDTRVGYHAGIKIIIFRVGMQSVNLSVKLSCSLLRETTQVWLLQLCLPSLTRSGGIDGTRQFGGLIFHTLVEKHGVFWTTLLFGHDTLLVTIPFQPMLLHLSWLEMGNTRLLIASHLDLSLKKCLTFRELQHQIQ